MINDPCFMDRIKFRTFEFDCKRCKELNYEYHEKRRHTALKKGALASLGRMFCSTGCYDDL